MGKMPSEGGGSGYADLENRPKFRHYYTTNGSLGTGSNPYVDLSGRVLTVTNTELTYKFNYENIRNTGGIGNIYVRLRDVANGETVAGPWSGGSGFVTFEPQEDAELVVQGGHTESSYSVQVNDVFIEIQ